MLGIGRALPVFSSIEVDSEERGATSRTFHLRNGSIEWPPSSFERRIRLRLACAVVLVHVCAMAPVRAAESIAGEAKAVLPKVSVRAETESDALPDSYPGDQVARGGRLGILGNQGVMDAPFNITNYTAQTIEDQQARSIADVLVNDPSAQLSSARTNIGEDFALRGFPMASQDVALNGMYGLMPFFRVPIEMAERVEVLKGPSAMLNGMPPSGNVGGGINVVTKRAGIEPLSQLSLAYLSDSTFGARVDLGRRFGTAQEFGARFNGAYRDGDTTIDRQSLQETVGSLNLDYVGERLVISADVIYQREEIDRVVRQFTAGPQLTDVPPAPDNAMNYPGYGYSIMRDVTWVLRGEYEFSEHLTAYGGFGQRNSDMDAVAGNPALLNSAGDFSAAPAWQLYGVDSNSAETGLRASFRTGSIEHRAVLGITRVVQDADIYFLFTAFPARPGNLYTPIYSSTPSTVGYPASMLRYTETELTSYAVADTLSFLDGRLEITAGARRQQVESQNYAIGSGAPTGPGYDDSATTPLAGVVYKPVQWLSLYANYIEGLSQGPTAPLGTANAGEVFAPNETKQKEIGAKADWGRFTTTVAAFEIKNPSGVAQNNRFSLNGEQRNRGLELNIFGELVPGVRLLGGGAYTRAELTSTANGAFDGNHAVAVPEVQINLGGEWDADFVPGLTLTTRAIHTGKQYVNQANNLSIPDWTRVDIGARYVLDTFDMPMVLRVNLDNALDKDYWAASNYGYLYLGAPRTLQVSATIDF